MRIERQLVAMLFPLMFHLFSASAYAQGDAIPTPDITIQGESVPLVPTSPKPPYKACYTLDEGTHKGYEFWPETPSQPSVCIEVSTGLSQVRVFNLGIAPTDPLPPGFNQTFTLKISWAYAGSTSYFIGSVIGGAFYDLFPDPAKGNVVSLFVECPEPPASPPPVKMGPVSDTIGNDPGFTLTTGVSGQIPCRKPGTTVPCNDKQITQFTATFQSVEEMLILPESFSTASCEDGTLCGERLQQFAADEEKPLQRELASSSRCLDAPRKADCQRTREGV